jgi:GTP-binding protein
MSDSQDMPTIAIVGRPNVGKSTLFNRLTGKWKSIVEDLPGITRDRLYGIYTVFGRQFRLMDTGGLTLDEAGPLERKMAAQAMKGIESADLIIFIMDGRAGLNPLDLEWIKRLRKVQTPKIFLVNKLDDPTLDGHLNDFLELGLDPLLPISAESQRNFSGLSDAVLKVFPIQEKETHEEEGDKLFGIAIAGRPNVGKSTLLNSLLNDERSLVHDAPGTTRDPVDTLLTYNGETLRLVDTAGIRKRAKTTERVEKFSVMASLKVIDRADLVLLVIDGELGPSDQDAVVAGYAFKSHKAIIIIVNKWDIGADKFTREKFEERMEIKMNYLTFCPILYVSAKTKKNLDKIMETVLQVRSQYETEVKTSELNRAFASIIDHHALPVYKNKDIKMKYVTQVGNKPPHFSVFCSEPKHVHFTYKRYLINALRDIFKLPNIPIKLTFRQS